MTAPERLLADLPPDRVATDPDVLAAYSRDDAAWAEAGQPIALVRPTSTDEVAAVVKACAAAGVPSCRAAPAPACPAAPTPSTAAWCSSLERMNRDRSRSTRRSGSRSSQPGVVNDDLRAAVAEHGLWYPPDPASAPWSTIGGNVATNAGGLCCVKYGVTRDYVLGARGRRPPTGEVVRLGPAHRQGRGGLRPRRADGRVGGHARRRSPRSPCGCGRCARAGRARSSASPTSLGRRAATPSRASPRPGCSPRRSS